MHNSRLSWVNTTALHRFSPSILLQIQTIICKGIWININQMHQIAMLIGHDRHLVKTVMHVICLLLFVVTQLFLLLYFLLPALPDLKIVLSQSLLLIDMQWFDVLLFFGYYFLTIFFKRLPRFGFLLQTFLFFESFECFEKLSSSFILLHLFVSNFVKKLLCMWSNLAECSASHMLMYFFPVFAISLNKLLKKVGLSSAPAAISFPVGIFVTNLRIIHFFRYVRDYTLKLHKLSTITSIYDQKLKEFTNYLSKSELPTTQQLTNLKSQK